jgi:O-antigen ligase
LIIDYISYFFAGAALIASVFKTEKYKIFKWSLLMCSLAMGEIYVSTIAIILGFFVDCIGVFKFKNPGFNILFVSIVSIFVILITIYSGFDERSLSEIIQMFMYIFLYLFIITCINSYEEATILLKSCFIASLFATILAFLTLLFNIQEPPYIFIARGSNEGAAIITLLGLLPASVLFLRERKLVYLITMPIFIYACLIATSRGGLLISLFVIAILGFFLAKNFVIKVILISLAIYLSFTSLTQIQYAVEDEVNFSTKERLILVEYGYDIALQNPWVGWGWGSTSSLAAQAPTLETYPHFHNTYIQILVEVGALGWALIIAFFYFLISNAAAAVVKIKKSEVSVLVLGGGFGLSISGVFDAMLFGADRAITFVIILSLISKIVIIEKGRLEGLR